MGTLGNYVLIFFSLGLITACGPGVDLKRDFTPLIGTSPRTSIPLSPIGRVNGVHNVNVVRYDQSKLYLGTTAGLRVVDSSSGALIRETLIDPIDRSIVKLSVSGQILCTIMDRGKFFLSRNSGVDFNEISFGSANPLSCFVTRDGVTFVGTSKGVCLISQDSTTPICNSAGIPTGNATATSSIYVDTDSTNYQIYVVHAYGFQLVTVPKSPVQTASSFASLTPQTLSPTEADLHGGASLRFSSIKKTGSFFYLKGTLGGVYTYDPDSGPPWRKITDLSGTSPNDYFVRGDDLYYSDLSTFYVIDLKTGENKDLGVFDQTTPLTLDTDETNLFVGTARGIYYTSLSLPTSTAMPTWFAMEPETALHSSNIQEAIYQDNRLFVLGRSGVSMSTDQGNTFRLIYESQNVVSLAVFGDRVFISDSIYGVYEKNAKTNTGSWVFNESMEHGFPILKVLDRHLYALGKDGIWSSPLEGPLEFTLNDLLPNDQATDLVYKNENLYAAFLNMDKILFILNLSTGYLTKYIDIGEPIKAIHLSDSGDLYLVTTAHVFRLNGGKIETLASGAIMSVSTVGDTLLYGTDDGTYRLRAGETNPTQVFYRMTYRIVPTPGAVMIGTQDDGLYLLDPSTLK